MKATSRPVSLVRSEYQPSKVELVEPIDVTRPDGTLSTPEELACAALRPVSVNWKLWPDR